MAPDQWIALVLPGICLIYGYAAWLTLDGGPAPFVRRASIRQYTFPKVLSVLAIGACLVIESGAGKSEVKEAEIDFHRLNEYKLGRAIMLLGLKVA